MKPPEQSGSRVVILGGYGVFGRQVARGLADEPGFDLVIAGRDPSRGQAFAESIGARFTFCSLADPASLREAIAGAYLVVNTSGPFRSGDYAIPRACIEQGCHYVDIGDGREYVSSIDQLSPLAEARGVFACVGASTTPAVTSALVAELQKQVPGIRSIKAALTAGNRNQAGVSTIASILAYTGRPVRVWQQGRWIEVTGWGAGETLTFPAPVGRRRVQLCSVPDLELFPGRFGADSVIFKAGVELTPFNYAFGGLAWLRRLRPSLNLPALAPALVRLSGLFKFLGTLHGSVAAWVTGADGHQAALAVVARRNGPQVAAAPAVLMARKIVCDGPPSTGAHPCLGFLPFDEIAAYLADFGITTARGQQGRWAG